MQVLAQLEREGISDPRNARSMTSFHATQGAIFTLKGPTKPAQAFAAQHQIEIVDASALVERAATKGEPLWIRERRRAPRHRIRPMHNHCQLWEPTARDPKPRVVTVGNATVPDALTPRNSEAAQWWIDLRSR